MGDPSSTESQFKGKSGLRRVLNALQYSLAGLRAAYCHEQAFRQEVWLAAPLVVVASLFPVDALGKALLIGSILLVLIVELMNSSIEAAVDYISMERHPLAKRAKDIGSAAVFVALVDVVVVWWLVLTR